MNTFCLDSPIGYLHLKASQDALLEISFLEEEKKQNPPSPTSGIISRAVEQLNEYFEDRRTVFELPLAPEGTEFQQQVWNALQSIPYGKTITYSGLSQKLGNPKAIRAVGRADGQNPIPIIIPCHRVVGANDELVGYAGGIERKLRLLQHEGALLL